MELPPIGPAPILAVVVGIFHTALYVLIRGVMGARLPLVLVAAILGAFAGEAAERSMAELTARLERVDAIADETQLTLARAREGIDAAVSIVRGPADVMEGARRTVQTVGGGLVSGADRLRRRMSREDEAAADH